MLLFARIRCWWKGHDWRFSTADFRYSACLACGKQRGKHVLDDEQSVFEPAPGKADAP
jgi:hypothetical protein